VQASFLTQLKLLATYRIPVVDMNLAATIQSTPGNVINFGETIPHHRGDGSERPSLLGP
jgi:hypothetical protein